MTFNEAISSAVRAVGDNVTRNDLTEWLCEIENTIIFELCATHDGDLKKRPAITEECEDSYVLTAPEPYSRLYLNYLIMKSDFRLRDITQYINSATAFADAYKDFADWYNRTYMPLGQTAVYL